MADGDVCLSIPIPCIEVTPSTGTNFLDFNREPEDLDSEWLMQPVNEADYDSETQFCVDTRANSLASYYDHYTTRRKKTKKRRRHVDAATSSAGGGGDSSDEGDNATTVSAGSAAAGGGVHLAMPGQQQHHHHVPQRAHAIATLEVPAAAAAAPAATGIMLTVPGSTKASSPAPAPKKDLLELPGMAAPPAGVLNNRACRRIACGALPPELRHKPANPVITAAAYNAAGGGGGGAAAAASNASDTLPPPPSYQEAVSHRRDESPDHPRAAAPKGATSFSSRKSPSPAREAAKE